jgi:translocation protein SEC66
MAANNLFRTKLSEIQEQTEFEKSWWEKRRASIQSEFMKELETESTSTAKVTASKTSSDEDAIMVEGGGPAVTDKGSIRRKAKK